MNFTNTQELDSNTSSFMPGRQPHIGFTNYLLGKIPAELTARLAPIFASLPADTIDYKENGFQSRFRAFSSFRYEGDAFIPDPSLLDYFNHKKEFHFGGSQSFPAWLINPANQKILQQLLEEIVCSAPIRKEADYHYGINAVRVVANDNFMGAPAPGLHQDGYNYSCHVNVTRENVSGGMSIIDLNQNPKSTMIRHELQPGDFVFFSDCTLHHTATAITPMYCGHASWRDMIIIDIVACDV